MFQDILQKTFLQNRILDYLTFLIVLSIGIITVRIFKSVILKRLKAWVDETGTAIGDFLIIDIFKLCFFQRII